MIGDDLAGISGDESGKSFEIIVGPVGGYPLMEQLALAISN